MVCVPEVPENLGGIVGQRSNQGMSVTIAIECFPSVPGHFRLSQGGYLHRLLQIGSSSLRCKTVEIESQDNIDIENHRGGKVALLGIQRVVQRFELGIVEIQLGISKIKQRSGITRIIDRTTGLHL